MDSKFRFGAWALAAAVMVACFAVPWSAAAGVFEVSFGVSYNRSTYSDVDYEWSRRWGTSFGYHFSDKSEIELAFQDVFDRTKITGFEDTTLHDRIYSLNWVQNLLGKNSPVQPYLKAGVGQLNRDATGTYSTGVAPPLQLDSLTVVLGAGARVFIFHNFAIRSEATTYLTGGSIRSWKDNVSANIGCSVYF